MSKPLDNYGSAPEYEPDIERELRTPAAQEIRDRLPAFLRHVKRFDLENRVRDARLLESVRAWRVGDPGMLLHGPTGIGKSSAAAILFLRLVGNGWRNGGDAWYFARGLRWYSAAALSQARREHPLGQGDAPEITRAESARLLVIDDAGWDRDTAAVSDVLAARYEKSLPTVVTTGLTAVELSKHYGAAVVRRFVEAGGGAATIVDCFVPSEQDESERRFP